MHFTTLNKIMKKIFISLLIVSVFYGCSSDNENLMTVKGTIDGLKKGTLYLQKIEDTLLISIDSVSLNGVNTFELETVVESPEIFYLTLNATNAPERILFFGEPGLVTINSRFDRFDTSFKISGGKNQQLLSKHQEMLRQFNDRQLELIERNFKATKAKNQLLNAKVQSEYDQLIKRKYLYTTNYAVQNADYEIAPYLALTDLYNANITLLDTINNSLSDKVRQSKYGKKLDEYIKNIKSAK